MGRKNSESKELIINMIFNFLKIIIFANFIFSFGISQRYSNDLPLKNKTGLNFGIFSNYGTSGFVIDGIFELKTKNEYFFESFFNSQIDSNSVLNNSIGKIKIINNDFFILGGYSNYLDIHNREMLHDIFFGLNYKSITTISYLGSNNNEIDVNLLGFLDLNRLFPKLPFSSSVMIVLEKNEQNFIGYDLFLSLFKTNKLGICYGYTLSSERFERKKLVQYNKSGKQYFGYQNSIDNRFEHMIHLGIII